MASRNVKIRVRPLRVGFLFDPADRVGLHRAIELSSFLWGRSYNPERGPAHGLPLQLPALGSLRLFDHLIKFTKRWKRIEGNAWEIRRFSFISSTEGIQDLQFKLFRYFKVVSRNLLKAIE